ncbi:uncharacterized protein LOC115768861 [Drosophila novamexicana]|uniref:uncharacterized protein LOC115768861 n=1 Tax=Drosophila novamexicana TaxID=47314 RepID=UPI0011E600CE|nr:uncharacterized protein LOC115768861 [Drosophila novamexicana]
MGMAGLSEDFITLTQLNCVQQCSALIHSPKPRNYITAATLFGIYCGVLAYRSYRNYRARLEAQIEDVPIEEPGAPEVQAYEEYVYEAPVTDPHEYLLPTIREPSLLEQHSNEEAVTAAP